MAIAGDIQQQVYDLLSRSSGLSFITADQEGGGRIGLIPGQRIIAEVLENLPNNRTQVRVGSERFNLDLPMAVRSGQNLEMTFVSEDPRATFAIARQGGAQPPVTLSDASRLLSLLISSEQVLDPRLRSSLQNIGDMLRRSSGQAGVLANLLDEALTYDTLRENVKAATQTPGDAMRESGNKQTSGQPQAGTRPLTPDQVRLAAFESNAAQILKNIAQNSRFVLVEAATLPQSPLPLLPGEVVNAVVTGTLPGGRTFLQVAGTPLELVLPRAVQPGELLRLTYIAADPKPTFALPRLAPELAPGALSEAGRWLSVLEHLEGGVSDQQMRVLERLNTVLKSLPPDSPAYTAILDEAITYQTVMRTQTATEQASAALLQAGQAPLPAGNGIVLTDDMAKLLQAVIKGNRLALLESLNQQAVPTGLVPGQQLKGEVLAALGGGRYMVQVAGQALEFMMPKGTQRGEMVNLFFIAEEPQVTFLMTRFGGAGDARVSQTGRWLSGFLGAAAEQLAPQATIAILRTLLSSPPTDASQVGRMLQQGLRESGLFYESHLARWFGGDYPLEELLKEPQGQLSPRLAQAALQPPGGAPDAPVPTALKAATAEVMENLFRKAGSSLSPEGIADQRALPVVSEQLSALQSGQHLFRGDLFPGQPMEWAVVERDVGRNDAGGRERSWETSLAISLPRLGPIAVRLVLDGQRISVDLQAENSGVLAELNGGRSRLAEQLEAAGLTPADLTVRHVAP